MSHEPVKIHITFEHALAETLSAKSTLTRTVLMSNHGVLLQDIQKPDEFFVDVTNTVPVKK
jgi:hypothetical protein